MFNGKYEYDKERLDSIIDEKGNQFIALRFARWKEDKDFKLEIRKFAISEDGETPLKGVTFLTEDGPNELVHSMLENGFGDPKEIANIIENHRPSVAAKIYKDMDGNDVLMKKVMNHENDEFIEDESEYYDPKEMLG